jgi:hypothetical protein
MLILIISSLALILGASTAILAEICRGLLKSLTRRTEERDIYKRTCQDLQADVERLQKEIRARNIRAMEE